MKKYPTTIGVELTYSLKNDKSDCYNICEKVKDKLTKLSYKIIKPKDKEFCKVLINNACVDSSVEMPTPILHNSYEADLAWHLCDYGTNGFGLQKKQKQTSGGHIHLGFDKKESEEKQRIFFINLTKWLVNRPWFAWGFNDPSDNINSRSMLTLENSFSYFNTKKIKFFGRFKELINNNLSSNNDNDVITIVGMRHRFQISTTPIRHSIIIEESFKKAFGHQCGRNYTHVIRPSYDTIEFRFFEMPRNYKRYQQHINVVFALRKRAYKEVKEEFRFKKISELKEISITTSLNEFQKDLIELGLNPSEFNWAFQNIIDRYKFGNEYLI